jgi:hypothetical protein
MWYFDDTGDGRSRSEKRPRYFYAKSNDGIAWSDPIATTIADPIHSGDVKYDPMSHRYLMFSVFNPHEKGSWLGVLSSADGLTWGPVERIGRLPDFSHNVGVQSDELGQLRPGAIEFTYGAPIGLVPTPSQGRWNLFGGRLQR